MEMGSKNITQNWVVHKIVERDVQSTNCNLSLIRAV